MFWTIRRLLNKQKILTTPFTSILDYAGCQPNHVPLFGFEFPGALKALEAMSRLFS